MPLTVRLLRSTRDTTTTVARTANKCFRLYFKKAFFRKITLLEMDEIATNAP
jgi:hypothetical protein